MLAEMKAIAERNCLSVLLYNIEALHLSITNVHKLNYPLNRAYFKVFHVQDKSSVSWCQFYMNQLPIELLIDSRRLWYLLKLGKTCCRVMSHVFGILSIKYIETLLVKYETIGSSANNHRLSKAALMTSIWSRFSTLLNARPTSSCMQGLLLIVKLPFHFILCLTCLFE